MTENSASPVPSAPSDASLGELVSLIAEQTSHLVRDELRLAKAEITQKGKKVGIGVGFLGDTGLLAPIGAGCLVAAAIPPWAARSPTGPRR